MRLAPQPFTRAWNVVLNFSNFGATADLPVAGVALTAIAVAGLDRTHAVNQLEHGLQAAETAAAQGDGLHTQCVCPFKRQLVGKVHLLTLPVDFPSAPQRSDWLSRITLPAGAPTTGHRQHRR